MVEVTRKVHSATSRRSAVSLRVYDISSGAAKTWSPILLGRQLDGVWHSGVEVFGYEYFYGGGIVKMRPENVETAFGISPVKKHHLGYTEMSRIQFETHLQQIRPMFKKEVYDLVNWNCNHFSDHVSRKLVNDGIPRYILDLPHEVCKTFMGKILLNFIKMMQGGAAPIGVDDPEHPSKTLVTDHTRRRNSCPASPSRLLTAQMTSVDPVVYKRTRHSHRHRTIDQSATLRHVIPSAEGAATQRSAKTQKIQGAPIGEQETSIVLSPKHKRLYELERDAYARPALMSGLKPRSQAIKPRVQTIKPRSEAIKPRNSALVRQ